MKGFGPLFGAAVLGGIIGSMVTLAVGYALLRPYIERAQKALDAVERLGQQVDELGEWKDEIADDIEKGIETTKRLSKLAADSELGQTVLKKLGMDD